MFNETWEAALSSQRQYIVEFTKQLELVEKKVNIATFLGDEEPTQAQLTSAWQTKTGFSDYVPTYSKVQWFNPLTEVVENVYLPVDNVGVGQSDGVLRTIIDQKRESFFDLIEHKYFDDDVQISHTFSAIAQDFIALMLVYSVQLVTTTGFVALNFRVNGLSAANYQAAQLVIGGGSVSTVGTSGVAQALMGVAPGSDLDKNLNTSGIAIFPFYNKANQYPTMFGNDTNNLTATTTRSNRRTNAFYSAVQAISSITVFFNGTETFKRGSRLALYGMK